MSRACPLSLVQVAGALGSQALQNGTLKLGRAGEEEGPFDETYIPSLCISSKT